MDPQMRRAAMVAADAAGLRRCGEVLRAGGNVAFPTETVYGLGGNALDEHAVAQIFAKKGRPLTDPLIVHVNDAEAALELVEARGSTLRLFRALAAAFWPGPLTMVLRASPKVPSSVCAGTGFVGVRSPDHEIARRLIAESGVPIAAPSANRFGHVSPTSAEHVMYDLADQDLLIVDGGDLSSGVCTVGIESTVLRVADPEVDDDDDDFNEHDEACSESQNASKNAAPRELVLFRKGGVPETELRRVLDEAGFVNTRIVEPKRASSKKIKEQETSEGEQEEGAMAPGQSVTHYAPDIDTWLLRKQEVSVLMDAEGKPQKAVLKREKDGLEEGEESGENDETEVELATCVVLDFGGELKVLEPHVLGYLELSKEGDAAEAARSLFSGLRWTETTTAQHVLIQDASHASGALAASVADRMFRAASGKVAANLHVQM